MKDKISPWLGLLLIGSLIAGSAASAQTAFTYQGVLNDGGSQASGAYDLQFTIYDDATNGNIVGATITNAATGVTNGLFTLPLDFGAGVFSGAPRWLEIGVRTNGSQDDFVILNPRQAVSPTPYAITATTISGLLPASQLSGPISASNLNGVQSANINLATNLVYTNYGGIGQALLSVIVGRTYTYMPTDASGNWQLQIKGTNYTDSNSYFVDVSGVGFLGAYTTSQIFTATQNTVTFVNLAGTNGPVNDLLFDAAATTNVGTLFGVGQLTGNVTGNLTGNVTGNISGGTLAGNAQGGTVTNLDYYVANTRDFGNVVSNAYVQWTNRGGVLYVAPGAQPITHPMLITTAAGEFDSGNLDSPLSIRGDGTVSSYLFFAGTNQTMFDNSLLNGVPGVNMRDIYASGAPNGTNNFYIGSPLGSGSLFWQNVQLHNFNIGASLTQSGIEGDNLEFTGNKLGLQLQWFSDGANVRVTRSLFQSAAGIEADSRGANIYFSSAEDQIGVVIGRGGNDFVQTLSEGDSNCVVAFGYPPSWPEALTNAGNGLTIGGGMFGFGYVYPGIPNADSPDPSAYMKIYNAPVNKVEVHSLAIQLGALGVVSFTNEADTLTPFSFDGVTTSGAPLFTFSDGTTIPSEDGYAVHVNDPTLWFTKNILKLAWNTNGDLYVAGDITNAGTLNTVTAQVGGLTITNAGANSLLGTDSGDNVTNITLGPGLALTGGTLSLSLGLVSSGLPTASSINAYTSDHLATSQDGTILVNGHGLTVTLPDAASSGAGRVYSVKLIANSTATVTTSNAQTIDGAASYSLAAQYKYVTLQSDGSQWWVIAGN